MVELLLRLETLLLGLDTKILLGMGGGLLLVGLILWLSGDRFGGAIIGLLGGAVGAAGGLFVAQWFEIDHTRCMLIGGSLLGIVSVLLRNILIMILAALVLAALSGGGYLATKLDAMTAKQAEEPAQTTQSPLIQSFRHMELADRKAYLDRISSEAGGFSERLRALLSDTWQRVEPYIWQTSGISLAGGVVALLLFWVLKKVVIALAYSVVGSAATLVGLQAGLLGLGVHVVPLFNDRAWALSSLFGGLVVAGWACQLFSGRPRKVAVEAAVSPPPPAAPAETPAAAPPGSGNHISLYQQAQLAKKRLKKQRRWFRR